MKNLESVANDRPRMNIFGVITGEIASRMKIVCDRSGKSSASQRFFAFLEIFCFPASLVAVALLMLQGGVILCGMAGFPLWLSGYVLPVLLAGAVGYLTNWLAIMMLFRPYEKKKWLFFWPQGLIPQNKPEVARAMGDEIGNNLLNLEKITAGLIGKLRSHLLRPDKMQEIIGKIRDYVCEHENELCEFLVPKIRVMLDDVISKELLTAENVEKLGGTVGLYLGTRDNQQKIADFIIESGQQNIDMLVDTVRSNLRQYIQTQLSGHAIVGFFPGAVDFLTNMVMGFASRDKIRDGISNWLNSSDAETTICNTLEKLRIKFLDWLRSDDGKKKMTEITGNMVESAKTKLDNFLSDKDKFPKLVESFLQNNSLWQWVEEKLPGVLDSIAGYIRGDADLIKIINLSGHIEEAVGRLEIQEFHQMINRIAAQHLGAIQVLGFILGIIIGLLQLLQTVLLSR